MNKYYSERYPMVKESYRKFIEEGQASADALRDLFIDDWMKKNPGSSREMAMKAYDSREGTLQNPAKHKSPKKVLMGANASTYG